MARICTAAPTPTRQQKGWQDLGREFDRGAGGSHQANGRQERQDDNKHRQNHAGNLTKHQKETEHDYAEGERHKFSHIPQHRAF